MADPLLPQPQIQESLSRSYLRALSARSGFITAEFDFDMAGIDMQIPADIGARSRALDVQLKATVNLEEPRDDADQLVGGDIPPVRPGDRQCTAAAADALAALRNATDLPGDGDALACALRDGATASLCDAVAGSLELLPRFEVAFDWALTLPKDNERETVNFDRGCFPAIRSAADYFRARELESSST